MRSARQHKVDIAVASAMSFVLPGVMPEGEVRADAARLCTPRATESELSDSLRYHDAAKRLTSVAGEMETHWQLNAQGRAWLTENT